MADKIAPLAGYELNWIFSTKQLYETKYRDDGGNWPAHQDFVIGWDWYPLESKQFLVLLKVSREPTEKDSGEINISALASFTVLDISAAVPFEHFVVQDAPMIMFPFVNEIVSSLTKHGFNEEADFIPVSHFAESLERFDFAASRGLAVLRDEPEKAALLGITHNLVQQTKKPRRGKRATK